MNQSADVVTLSGLPLGWVWVSVGLMMLVAETLGTAGFLLGAALAAFVTGLISFVAPALDWRLQVLCFGVLALVFTVIYWKRFRRFNQSSDKPELNQRMQQMIGTLAVVPANFSVEEGRLQFGDTLWRVRSSVVLTPGMHVKVTGVEGMMLIVEPL